MRRDLKSEYQKEEYETKVDVNSKSEIGRDVERAAGKLGAGARAIVNKTDAAYRDLRKEYRKQKMRGKLD